MIHRLRFINLALAVVMVFGALGFIPKYVSAATPTELFISEYIEGSGYNKAIEIYNGTGSPLDLSTGGYNIQIFFNGNDTAILTIYLTGTVTDGDVFVIANTNSTNPADPAILAEADLISSASFFNGDDAVVIRKGTTIIDVIGQIGFDPGDEWGTGLTSTKDNTLRRMSTICMGDPDGSNAFDPSVEWVGFSQNTFDGLGSHTANCGVTPSEPILVINEIDYDQPSTDTTEFIEIKNVGAGSADLNEYSLQFVNGAAGGAAQYQLFALPTVSLAAGDYFVLCANAATVANCDLDVSPDTNLIQNGDPDAVALLFGTTIIIDTVSYEGNTASPYTEVSGDGLDDPGAVGSISRCPDGTDTNQNNVDFVFTATITPGAENSCPLPPPLEVCGNLFTPIYEVQGSGASSPLVGTEVAIEGVVVGDFQNNALPDNGDLNGFHIQDPISDGDPTTSDGVFVYAPGGIDVTVGDGVRVRGSVSEYNGMTEITASQMWVCSSGNSIAPTTLSLPVASVDDFEAYEGMLVTFLQDLYISEYFNFDRYGEIVLTSTRHLTPTAQYEPGSQEVFDAMQAYILDRILVDDGRTTQNPDPASHPNGSDFTLDNLFRGGDLVTNLTGVLDYGYNLYRIQPTQGADYTAVNLRTETPDIIEGDLKVASFNVLNYFLDIDYGVDYCGPSGNMECRGADTIEELERQRAKILAALSDIEADIFGLMEIQNDEDESVADLVAGLNEITGTDTYTYIHTGFIGTDAIKVALIYKPGSVTPVGNYAILDSTVDPRFIDTLNRPVLAQTFKDNLTNETFTVAVNHLKSKGSACDVDPDLGDGAGNCNLTRKAAAEALVDWLANNAIFPNVKNYLIIGDLNSYDKEDPIDVIKAGPDGIIGTKDDYLDTMYEYRGEYAYGYVFDGQIGYLDYAMANLDMASNIVDVNFWHINADEADLINYDLDFKLPAQVELYAPDAYRSSDHDPVIISLIFGKITICHATGGKSSPYIEVTVRINSMQGHDKHKGDIIPMPVGGCPTTRP